MSGLRRSPAQRRYLGIALACSGSLLLAASGCSTNQCDPSSVTVASAGNWQIVGDCSTGPAACELVWLSSPTLGTWQSFQGQYTYKFMFPPLPTLPPGLAADFSGIFPPQAWVASVPPDEPDANFTEASGQLAEFGNISSQSISVTNAGCAKYSVLVEVTVPVVAIADAGSGPD
jgi:hypothetical protein